MLAVLILAATPLLARDRNGVLLTNENQEGTHAEKASRKAIKKEQDDALKALKSGNQYHVKHLKGHPSDPKIMVVSCADAHVPPEDVFHMGQGKLYTNRAWGNMVDKVLLGSLEYGVDQLGCRVLVVMGHSDCTAVREAIAEYEHPRQVWSSLNAKALYEELKPGVAEMEEAQVKTEAQVGKRLEGKDLADAVIKNNVLNTIHAIRQKSALIWHKEYTDELKIVGCIYHKDTGAVEWLSQ
jgi:carbonic anhydrase